MTATLRPYQQSGYDWLWFLHQYGLRGILADDMGLGKTIQTLSVILAHTEQASPPPSIVICPASVTNVWHSEIQRWCSGIKPLLFSNADRKHFPQGLRPGTIVIASYNAVSRHIGLFESLVWSYVVLDEAHRIKNPNAASTKACKRLIAHHKLAVTGTPIQNRLAELWSIFDFLMPGYLGSAVRFQREYEIPITQNKNPGSGSALACSNQSVQAPQGKEPSGKGSTAPKRRRGSRPSAASTETALYRIGKRDCPRAPQATQKWWGQDFARP